MGRGDFSGEGRGGDDTDTEALVVLQDVSAPGRSVSGSVPGGVRGDPWQRNLLRLLEQLRRQFGLPFAVRWRLEKRGLQIGDDVQ